MESLANQWATQFYEVLNEDRDAATELRGASLAAKLDRWTKVLTGVVVRSFEALGLAASAKGHPCKILPVGRGEYLGQDVMAFRAGTGQWRFPAAVCELENLPGDKNVAYSLWKVLCVRCDLRMVFCYRKEPAAGSPLVAALASDVVGAIPVAERIALAGDTLVIVGSRNEAETFPNGFFQTWKLNLNTGRFEKFQRK